MEGHGRSWSPLQLGRKQGAVIFMATVAFGGHLTQPICPKYSCSYRSVSENFNWELGFRQVLVHLTEYLHGWLWWSEALEQNFETSFKTNYRKFYSTNELSCAHTHFISDSNVYLCLNCLDVSIWEITDCFIVSAAPPPHTYLPLAPPPKDAGITEKKMPFEILVLRLGHDPWLFVVV